MGGVASEGRSEAVGAVIMAVLVADWAWLTGGVACLAGERRGEAVGVVLITVLVADWTLAAYTWSKSSTSEFAAAFCNNRQIAIYSHVHISCFVITIYIFKYMYKPLFTE